MAVSSCGLTSGGSHGPIPRIPHAVVVVTMKEYRLDYERPVPGGRVVFRVVNAGRYVHRLSMLPLPEDFPPIDQQLRGRQRRVVAPLAGVPGLRPGSSDSFAVDLVPGQRYGVVDLSGNPNGQSNALLGMASEFRAGGGRPGPRARPSPSAKGP